ncbi:MAG: hypothetical protein J6A67_00875 [Clostridia bacterium]|nr:hypothetical protein [Clostridia bacterium]
MITYDLMLDRQRLIGADKFTIAANANNTIFLHFHFDRSWRRFDSKAAVFRNYASEYYIIEITADRAKVPWEVLTHQGEFELSVIGFEDEKVLTSDKVEILVEESLLPEDCKTLSPSEVLFDRFKRECIAQAYLDYEDEINELKRTHIIEKMALAEQINEANERTQNVIEEKNNEIEQLNIQHEKEKIVLGNQIRELNTVMFGYKEKADKWDLIDTAVSQKTYINSTLWSGGKEKFILPMLNTSSIPAFAQGNFSANLMEIGLDLSSATVFTGVFSSHQSLRKLELKNAHNITSFANMIEGCNTVKTVSIDSLKSCNSLSYFASEAKNLEIVNFGADVAAGAYDRAFYGCSVLREINGIIDCSFATNIGRMFIGCASLEKVMFVENTISVSGIDFSSCTKLSRASMINIFNALYTGASNTLTISSHAFENNFDQAEQEEWIAFVTEIKGWVLTIK